MNKQLPELYRYIQKELPLKRFRHCASTAICAEMLARKYNERPDPVIFAAMAHDIARDFAVEKLIRLCADSAIEIPDEYMANPVLLHGPAGAVFVKKQFGAEDPRIEKSIFWHTSGHVSMDESAKIVYIADYIEALRTHISIDERERVFSLDLDRALLYIMRKQREYFKKYNMHEISYFTQLINRLEVN